MDFAWARGYSRRKPNAERSMHYPCVRESRSGTDLVAHLYNHAEDGSRAAAVLSDFVHWSRKPHGTKA